MTKWETISMKNSSIRRLSNKVQVLRKTPCVKFVPSSKAPQWGAFAPHKEKIKTSEGMVSEKAFINKKILA